MHTSTIHPQNSVVTRNGFRIASRAMMLAALAICTGFSVRTLSAQVPATVATTQTTLASGIASGGAVTDACGNVYINENAGHAGVIRISAATGAVTTVIPNYNSYNGGTAIYMDRAKANLYVDDPQDESTSPSNPKPPNSWYSSEFTQIPITNCTPGTPNLTFGNNASSFFSYYYGTAADITGDAAGDVFFTNITQNGNNVYGIVEEKYTASSNSYASSLVYSGSTEITSVASDAAGNLYFSTGNGTVNFLAAPYTGAATVFSSAFNSVAGLSFDAAGNLYISDGGASILYEAPIDATTSAPSAANLYAVASVGLVFKVGSDASENIYLSNYYPGAVKLSRSSATAPATALGSTSGSFGINYIFNAAVTPTSITAVTGTSTSTTFSPGTGGCATGGSGYKVLGTCTVYATYTPSAIGEQTGAILFTSSAGTVVTNVSGIGQGAAVTIDPGTVVPTTTTLTAPNGVTIDNLGNVYVTDSSANTLTEFAAGSNGVGTPVSTGTITLNAPSAVAVDNVGDIFIANTGANQVVEIPVINGVLTNASTAALPITLKNPQGVATDGAGNLYIADTGDNNLLYVPSISGVLDTAAASSYGTALNGPSAVTVDPSGNVYVAEAGNEDLLEFAAPFGSSAQIKVASGFNDPTSLATDASGSVYVADSGSGSIFRYANVGGNLGGHTLVGSTLAHPVGVAVDANGNLYATDKTDDIVAEIQRVTTALQFGGWNVGSTSTPFTGTVNNSGNEPLIFKTPSYTASGNTSAGFTVTTDGCAGTTDLPGTSCDITATFTPTMPELNAQENLALNSNAANGSPVLELVGTGAHITPSTLTLTLTSPAGATSLNAGQPATFTATINTNGGTATPGGTVKFYVNGSLVGTEPVANSAASITLANGLPAGSAVVVEAVYSGDVINYSGSTTQITENVIALPDTLTLTLTPKWNNPNSSNDNSANANGPVVPLTATVVPSTATIPTGTITFYAGTNTLGVKQVLPLASGVYGATLDTTALRAGTTNQVENGSFVTNYAITATYSGDNTYYPANSNTASIAIVGPPATQPACATSTPATCGTNTTGAFYTISPTNPTITATTTTAGGPASGSTTLTLNSYGGYNGILNFTCSGLPAYATCGPYPGYPTVVPSTPTANVVPTTVDFIINTNVAPIVPTGSSMVWWFSGAAGFVLLLLRRRIQRMGYLRGGQLFTIVGALLLCAGSVLGLGGCSSTGYSYITPAGTSTITVKVQAAQLNLGSNEPAGATFLNDPNPTTFQITLIVK